MQPSRMRRAVLGLGMTAAFAAVVVQSIPRLSGDHSLAAALLVLGLVGSNALVVRMPTGEQLSLDAALCLAALLSMSSPDATVTIAIGLLAMLLTTGARAISFALWGALASKVALVWLFGEVAARVLVAPPSTRFEYVLPALLFALAYLTCDVIISVYFLSSPSRVLRSTVAQNMGALVFTTYLSQAAMGVAAAVAYASIGVWGLAVVVGLAAVMRHTFSLYLRMRSAYHGTVKALSKAVEMQEGSDVGHAERVAARAREIGWRLRLSPRSLHLLEYAALLHDVGKIGSAHDESGNDHARRGSALLGKVEFLRSIARPVLYHHATAIEARQALGREEYLISQIVAVSSALDTPYCRNGMNDGCSFLTEADPVVVEAAVTRGG